MLAAPFVIEQGIIRTVIVMEKMIVLFANHYQANIKPIQLFGVTARFLLTSQPVLT